MFGLSWQLMDSFMQCITGLQEECINGASPLDSYTMPHLNHTGKHDTGNGKKARIRRWSHVVYATAMEDSSLQHLRLYFMNSVWFLSQRKKVQGLRSRMHDEWGTGTHSHLAETRIPQGKMRRNRSSYYAGMHVVHEREENYDSAKIIYMMDN